MLIVVIWLALMVVFAWLGYVVGRKSGHPTRGLVLGLLLSWVGVLLEWLIGRNERPAQLPVR